MLINNRNELSGIEEGETEETVQNNSEDSDSTDNTFSRPDNNESYFSILSLIECSKYTEVLQAYHLCTALHHTLCCLLPLLHYPG